MTMVSFVDETTAGARSAAWFMDISAERLTLRELIRRRIHHEVAEFHATRSDTFRGLVQPTDLEAILNDHGTRRIDAERQVELAMAAFERNGFVALVDDHQVEELDDVVELRHDTQVTFLKLVALVGG